MTQSSIKSTESKGNDEHRDEGDAVLSSSRESPWEDKAQKVLEAHGDTRGILRDIFFDNSAHDRDEKLVRQRGNDGGKDGGKISEDNEYEGEGVPTGDGSHGKKQQCKNGATESDNLNSTGQPWGGGRSTHQKFATTANQGSKTRGAAKYMQAALHIEEAHKEAKELDEAAAEGIREQLCLQHHAELEIPVGGSRLSLQQELLQEVGGSALIVTAVDARAAPGGSVRKDGERRGDGCKIRRAERDKGEAGGCVGGSEICREVGYLKETQAAKCRAKAGKGSSRQLSSEDRLRIMDKVSTSAAKRQQRSSHHITRLTQGQATDQARQLRPMLAKQNFLKNPRYVSPRTDAASSVCPFAVTPSVVLFQDFEPGKVYEQTVSFFNDTSVGRRLRLHPPCSDVFGLTSLQYTQKNSINPVAAPLPTLTSASGSQEPGSLEAVVNHDSGNISRGSKETHHPSQSREPTGVVAPGLCTKAQIWFAPTALESHECVVEMHTECGVFLLPIQARRRPPALSLPSEIDCGCHVPGPVAHATCVRCENTGSEASFMIVSKTTDPHQGDPQEGTSSSDTLICGHFEVSPIAFLLKTGEAVDIHVKFMSQEVNSFRSLLTIQSDEGSSWPIELRGVTEASHLELTRFDSQICSGPRFRQQLDQRLLQLEEQSRHKEKTIADDDALSHEVISAIEHMGCELLPWRISFNNVQIDTGQCNKTINIRNCNSTLSATLRWTLVYLPASISSRVSYTPTSSPPSTPYKQTFCTSPDTTHSAIISPKLGTPFCLTAHVLEEMLSFSDDNTIRHTHTADDEGAQLVDGCDICPFTVEPSQCDVKAQEEQEFVFSYTPNATDKPLAVGAILHLVNGSKQSIVSLPDLLLLQDREVESDQPRGIPLWAPIDSIGYDEGSSSCTALTAVLLHGTPAPPNVSISPVILPQIRPLLPCIPYHTTIDIQNHTDYPTPYSLSDRETETQVLPNNQPKPSNTHGLPTAHLPAYISVQLNYLQVTPTPRSPSDPPLITHALDDAPPLAVTVTMGPREGVLPPRGTALVDIQIIGYRTCQVIPYLSFVALPSSLGKQSMTVPLELKVAPPRLELCDTPEIDFGVMRVHDCKSLSFKVRNPTTLQTMARIRCSSSWSLSSPSPFLPYLSPTDGFPHKTYKDLLSGSHLLPSYTAASLIPSEQTRPSPTVSSAPPSRSNASWGGADSRDLRRGWAGSPVCGQCGCVDYSGRPLTVTQLRHLRNSSTTPEDGGGAWKGTGEGPQGRNCGGENSLTVAPKDSLGLCPEGSNAYQLLREYVEFEPKMFMVPAEGYTEVKATLRTQHADVVHMLVQLDWIDNFEPLFVQLRADVELPRVEINPNSLQLATCYLHQPNPPVVFNLTNTSRLPVSFSWEAPPHAKTGPPPSLDADIHPQEGRVEPGQTAEMHACVVGRQVGCQVQVQLNCYIEGIIRPIPLQITSECRGIQLGYCLLSDQAYLSIAHASAPTHQTSSQNRRDPANNSCTANTSSRPVLTNSFPCGFPASVSTVDPHCPVVPSVHCLTSTLGGGDTLPSSPSKRTSRGLVGFQRSSVTASSLQSSGIGRGGVLEFRNAPTGDEKGELGEGQRVTDECLRFENIDVSHEKDEVSRYYIVITNMSGIATNFYLHMNHYGSGAVGDENGNAKEEGTGLLSEHPGRQGRHTEKLLTEKHEGIKFQSGHGKTQCHQWKYKKRRREALEDKQGFAVCLWPKEGILQPFETVYVVAEAFADLPGQYKDKLLIKLPGNPPMYWDILATATGNPIYLPPQQIKLNASAYPWPSLLTCGPVAIPGDAGGHSASQLLSCLKVSTHRTIHMTGMNYLSRNQINRWRMPHHVTWYCAGLSTT
eukprot:GHVQ01003231.1.p1 GENE.GHVQ01003231.1~~GHVQ01003231.1.p1  ORF type:complete len:1851 (-),score=311.57 GHVQ01003231.1:3460-9012(-)